ncbi:MAG: ubiquinol-cytochrome c reductase iron-sulfur subunit [bacterium]
MEDTKKITRRSFVDYLLLVTGAGVLGTIAYPVLKFILPPAQSEPNNLTMTVMEAGALARGEFKIFEFNRKPAIIIRTGADAKAPESYHALSAVCTHLHCTVQYENASGQILCACHNGRFNLQGQVLSGPPPSALTAFQVEIQNGKIVVAVQGA